MPERVHVCSRPGCPELAPCPTHGRLKNARWSKDRDGAAQNRFAAAVKARDGHRCVNCGSTWKLQAHHTRPGYDPACGITLCGRCHKACDNSAR